MSNFIIPIQSVPTIASITEQGAAKPAKATGDIPFADVLKNAVENIQQTGTNSQDSMYDLAVGGTDDLHSGAIDMLKNSTAVTYATGLTSSVIRAYNELIKMSI